MPQATAKTVEDPLVYVEEGEGSLAEICFAEIIWIPKVGNSKNVQQFSYLTAVHGG